MEWINVKDRWPTKEEQDQRILVWYNDGSELMGVQPIGAYIGPCDPYTYRGPSHWMPLPESPKESNDVHKMYNSCTRNA